MLKREAADAVIAPDLKPAALRQRNQVAIAVAVEVRRDERRHPGSGTESQSSGPGKTHAQEAGLDRCRVRRSVAVKIHREDRGHPRRYRFVGARRRRRGNARDTQ